MGRNVRRVYDTMAPMAKKKNQSKKHRFKYAEPTSGLSASSGSNQPARTSQPQDTGAKAAALAGAGRTGVAAQTRDFSYVLVDLRRLSVLAVALVALELILWYLLSHTSLGSAVYRLLSV